MKPNAVHGVPPQPTDRIRKRVTDILKYAGVRKLIVGVSGGADSMALLDLLASRPEIEVHAVHCNFHLRGAESNRDMNHVRHYCAAAAIPLSVVHFDVVADMRENGGSVEMSCRRLRYAEFHRLMRETGADRIAVAHNADDQSETVLLNLMRGGGVAGLRAMRLDTGEIIRPLLTTPRTEIEAYLAERGITFMTDSSNLDSDYMRNFLRNEIIPALCTRWPAARDSLCRTAANMARDEKMLDWAERRLSGTEASRLPFSALAEAPDPAWLVRRFVLRHGGSGLCVPEIVRALSRVPPRTGLRWKAGSGVITLERGFLEFTDTSKPVKVTAESSRHEVTATLMATIRTAPLTQLWTTLPPERLEFRTVLPGDRINPLGMHGSTPVSKILKDAALPFSAKRTTVVARDVQTDRIIWVAGLKRSRHGLVEGAPGVAYLYNITVNPGP